MGERAVIDYLIRFHNEMWWDRYAMIACVVVFVAGVELSAWGSMNARQTQARKPRHSIDNNQEKAHP